jgi:hypothetical protein
MSVPTSNISFRDISNVFGGTDPISLSEYYANATPNYTSGVSGVPNIGSAISISQFSGKSKPVAVGNVLVSGNKTANMDFAGYGNSMTADDSYLQIGMNFPFYFLGGDYGSNNNIYWNTNGALTFGNANVSYNRWGNGNAGFLLGQMDRYLNNIYLINTYTSGSYNVKRIVIDMRDYSSPYPDSDWEIRLIRGPDYQYIELSMNSMSYRAGYWWCGSNGSAFFDVFGNGISQTPANPIGAGESFVLRSDLNGNNWTYFRNHRVNI